VRRVNRQGCRCCFSLESASPYLIARTLLRKATIEAGPGRTDMDTLAQAEEQLGKVLNNSGLAAVHPDAQRLLNHVRALLHPAERLQELATAILRQNSETTLEQELWDYRILSRTIPNGQLRDGNGRQRRGLFVLPAPQGKNGSSLRPYSSFLIVSFLESFLSSSFLS
jgi:hypothetical protein